MTKAQLVNRINNVLEKNDYSTCRCHGCFDVAARKEKFLLLKVLTNIDAFDEDYARSMGVISRNLDAGPVLIGSRSSSENLKLGVVYERYGIPSLSIETFEMMIREEIMPAIFSGRGGTYVEVDGKLLKSGRTENGFTQSKLGDVAGITKKSVYEHERGVSMMKKNVADKIESVLGKSITTIGDMFGKQTNFDSFGAADEVEVSFKKSLGKIGFSVEFLRGASFNTIGKGTLSIISGSGRDPRALRKLGLELLGFSDVSGTAPFVVTDDFRGELDVPSIDRLDLPQMSRREFLRTIRK